MINSSHFNIAIEPVKQTAGELYRRVDAEYYGYHDEEDESLLAYEAQREEECK
jgi:hypothetical protein